MTVNNSKEIRIPAWILSVFAPVVVAVVGYALGIASINAKVDTEISNLKENIIRLEGQKANAEVVDGMQKSLNRIETKLDMWISKNGD